MPDVIRTLSALQTLLADNTAGDISPQDVRDMLVSTYPVLRPVPQGRLTTETGVPVSVSDRTSQGTIYYTPYNGNGIWLYDGTVWKPYTFTERSLALSGLTSGKNYDVFIYDNTGTLTLELSAAWTTDTARADALTTQDGVYVKSGATTRLYIGTIRTTSTTATEDSAKNRFLWNLHNRRNRRLMFLETTGSWTYGTATAREVRGDTTESTRSWVRAVAGLAGMAPVKLNVNYLAGADAGRFGLFSVGIDGATPDTSNSIGLAYTGAAGSRLNGVGGPLMFKDHGIGYHFYQALERANIGTIDIYGTLAGEAQSGIIGEIEC